MQAAVASAVSEYRDGQVNRLVVAAVSRRSEPEAQPVRIRPMRTLRPRIDALLVTLDRWLASHSITLLRWALGAIFLGFGLLKLFPGASPAEYLATETMSLLTFGLVGHTPALVGVALLECTIGLSLLTGRLLGVGLFLLSVAFVGILSPLVLLADELFTGPGHAPNLLGQYVLKDLILVAAALVVAAAARGAHLVGAADPEQIPARQKMEIVLAGMYGDRSINAVCAEHQIPEELFFRWRDEVLDGTARTVAACESDGTAKHLLRKRVAAAAQRQH